MKKSWAFPSLRSGRSPSGLGPSASLPPVPTAFGEGSGGNALQRTLRST